MNAGLISAVVRFPRSVRGALLVAAFFALASLATGGENPNPRGKSGPWVDGHRPHPSEIVVRFAKTASVEARAQLVRRLGLIERHSSANDYGVGVYDAPGRAPEFGTALRRASIIQAWGPAWIDPAGNLRHYVPGELTVQFEPGVAAGAGEAVIRELGARIVRREQVPGYYTITVPEGLDWAEAIRLFEAHDSVAFAEPSEIGFDDALLIPK